MSSSESNGHEPFELDPTEMLPQKPETSPVELSLAPRVPFLIKREEVPQRNFTGDTPFKETHEAALKMVSTVAPPKIRQNVYQLNSQNLEAHKQRIAEMSKPATWAQAVQPKNNLPNNKAAVGVVVERQHDRGGGRDRVGGDAGVDAEVGERHRVPHRAVDTGLRTIDRNRKKDDQQN